MIGKVNIIKNGFESSAQVVQMVMCVLWSLCRDWPGFETAFCQTFFFPFQISYHNVKAFIFNKNYVNNQKVENKVPGRVRVGVGRALLYQQDSIHLIIWIKKYNLHSIGVRVLDSLFFVFPQFPYLVIFLFLLSWLIIPSTCFSSPWLCSMCI